MLCAFGYRKSSFFSHFAKVLCSLVLTVTQLSWLRLWAIQFYVSDATIARLNTIFVNKYILPLACVYVYQAEKYMYPS